LRRFGSQVTLIQHSPRLLMSEDGITVLTATTP